MYQDIWKRLKEPKPYYIADIGANHDGDLNRALMLIELAKESGAHAAKFQNFKAETIVSGAAFAKLSNSSHQSNWNKSVYEVYKSAELNLEWTEAIKLKCDEVDIEYFTSPYDLKVLDQLDEYMRLFKIGSGDITWLEIIERAAKKGKPVLIATGASTQEDVDRAMKTLLKHTKQIVLMQCNTNYTLDADKYRHVNLNVLDTYKNLYPDSVLGLSDHTAGFTSVLGAIAKGAFVIEKHFTDDNDRVGPDHPFAINPKNWGTMVSLGNEMADTLGDGKKIVESNEIDSRVVQQRSLTVTREMKQGDVIFESDLKSLRPCPDDAWKPFELNQVLGKTLTVDLDAGTNLLKKHIK
jgi:N-acetylneuraminate synthase